MSDIVQSIHPNLQIIFSTVADGSMAAGGGVSSLPEHGRNVEKFLLANDFPTERTRVYVTYNEANSYTEVTRVTDDNLGQDVTCDALYTTSVNQVITLPVADCVATVVYDPVASMLGVLHLGRHSSVAGLIESFIIEVADNVGSDPADWHVWMSPSIRAENDRMDYFRPPNSENWHDYNYVGEDGKVHIDAIGHNISRFVRAGVSASNIIVSPIDSYADKRFYSQRAYVEQADDRRLGRMMVAARIIAQPATI